MSVRGWVGLAAAVLGGAVLTGCGDSYTPNSPAAPATPATPAPSPTPPPAVGFTCPLPPSSNPENNCPKLAPRLGDYVNGAIDNVIAKHPELFNLSETNGGNPKVLDRQKYHEAVKAELERQGVCTLIEKEEIAVKTTNDFNEQWNIWTSDGYVRRKLITTCIPAWW
jgi:hypothetical protein